MSKQLMECSCESSDLREVGPPTNPSHICFNCGQAYPGSGGFVIQLCNRGGTWRRAFLRWTEAFESMGFIEYAEGHTGPAYGAVKHPAGPALGGRMVTYPTREDADAMLAKCIATGQLLGLVDACVVRPVEDVDPEHVGRA